MPILDESTVNRNNFNLLLLGLAIFLMGGDATLAHTPRDTLAGCAPINSDRAAQFAVVVIGSMLVSFCNFVTA